MKKNLFKSLLVMMFTTAVLVSCKKTETEEPVVAVPQLVKVTSWNPSLGTEYSSLELTYDAKGTVTTAVFGGTTYAVTYNAANKVSLLSGTVKGGYTVSYALEYNTAGQLTKIVNSNVVSSSDNSNTKTLTYNAAGKISKSTTIYTNTAITPYVVDYTWNGDNLATASINAGSYVSTYVTFDDKINPLSLGDGIIIIYYGGPASKNNVTETKTVSGSTTNVQKKSYEYNSAGYAVNMKLLDGSNEGMKFYYNK